MLRFKKTSELMPYVDAMFDVFNTAYAKLSSFVAVTDAQKEYFKKKYINLINPEYILFILDENKKLIAFSIVMPDFSDALIKAKGNGEIVEKGNKQCYADHGAVTFDSGVQLSRVDCK